MSGDRLVVPGLYDDEQDEVDYLWAQLSARRPRNLLRASYYDGKRAQRQMATAGVIAPQYQRLGLILGWNAKGVDMLARRWNLDGFYWPDGDLDSLGYAEVRDGNHLFAELKSGVVSALIHGTSFVINTTGNPAVGEPQSLVHVKDALNATGRWSNRTRRLVALLSVTSWGEDDRPDGLVLYLHGLTVTAWKEAGTWRVERQSHRYGVPADPLVYKPRTGREFGSSRITRETMSLQDAGVRALIRMEGHMDIYSTPQMLIIGGMESMFRNADGSQKASWQIALGRVLGIPDDPDEERPELARADVKQFAASSPEPHLAQLNALAKLTARAFSLPDPALAISDMANPTSAEAYVAANDDLIAEAEGVGDDMDVPLRRSMARALAIQNSDPDLVEQLGNLGTQLRSPVHVSRAAAADAGSKQVAAVPWLADTEVGLELMGLSESQIRRAVQERSRAQGRATLNALLAGGVTADAVE